MLYEKNVFSVLQIYVRSSWFIALLKSSISLLIFGLFLLESLMCFKSNPVNFTFQMFYCFQFWNFYLVCFSFYFFARIICLFIMTIFTLKLGTYLQQVLLRPFCKLSSTSESSRHQLLLSFIVFPKSYLFLFICNILKFDLSIIADVLQKLRNIFSLTSVLFLT